MTPPPFSQVRAIRNCPCEDGKSRYVPVGTPDTFFSIPGRINVSAKGKRYSIAGYVGHGDPSGMSFQMSKDDENYGYYFRAYKPRIRAIARNLTGLTEEAPDEALIDNLQEIGHAWLVPFFGRKSS